jgi:glycosyltransferase involved in cell wall biosynthesis
VVTGGVSDEELGLIYEHVRIMVVPLRFGAGVKGKILEAFNSGVPVIATDIAAEGIGEKESCLVLANTSSEWLSVLPRFYNDEKALTEKSRMGKIMIKKYYSIEAASRIILQDMPF